MRAVVSNPARKNETFAAVNNERKTRGHQARSNHGSFALPETRRPTECVRKVIKYFFLGLVLLLVYLSSALLAMRFAIQGREVHVPRLAGLTPAEAERVANSDGLVLSVESRFYSPSVPAGRIISSRPPGATVRRGWKIRVAASLGTEHAAIPNLVGQSQHAAGIQREPSWVGNWDGRGHTSSGATPDTVLAQSPSP